MEKENSSQDYFKIRKKGFYSFLVFLTCLAITFFNFKESFIPLLEEKSMSYGDSIYTPLIMYLFIAGAIVTLVSSFRELKPYSSEALIYGLVHVLWVGPFLAIILGIFSSLFGILSLVPFPNFLFIALTAGLFFLGILGSIIGLLKEFK